MKDSPVFQATPVIIQYETEDETMENLKTGLGQIKYQHWKECDTSQTHRATHLALIRDVANEPTLTLDMTLEVDFNNIK